MKFLIISFLVACASAQFYPGTGYAYNYGYNALPYAASPLTYKVAAPVVAAPVAPLVAKQTVKFGYLEKNEAAKTPADTTKLDNKFISQDVYTPYAYSYPSYAYSYPGYGYAYPGYGFPYGYPFAAQAAAPATAEKEDSVQVESSRKKRQIAAAYTPYDQFAADLAYDSVDLNEDGQPDKAAFVAPVAYRSYPFAYAAGYPQTYATGYPKAYAAGYPFNYAAGFPYAARYHY
jgi:hypothetical protein